MKLRFFMPVLVPLVLAVAYLAERQVGHGVAYGLFTLLNLVLLRLITVGRLSWFYTFMAVFFFLGCWLKVSIHHIFDYPYVEPTGNFSDSAENWRDYYLVASVLAGGLVLARLVLWVVEHRSAPAPYQAARPVAGGQWLALIAVAAAFYAVNNVMAFFVTGVDARVSLPFALNAPLAFMALIGFAVVAAAHFDRDVAARRAVDSVAVLAVLTVASIASISMASRAAVVMQAVPMLVAAAYLQRTTRGGRVSLRPFLLLGLFMLVVLVVVSIYRITVFSGSSTANTELVGFFALESALLVVDRWIGAEAIMVAVSEPTQSVALLMQLLAENPALGTDSVYQGLAGSRYGFLQGLTFLTLPGYFGVLGLSGSAGLTFVGAGTVAMVGMVYERFIGAVLRHRTITIALISAAIANALTQLSFPRLLIPFVFQMTALVVIIRLTERAPSRRTAGDDAPRQPAKRSPVA